VQVCNPDGWIKEQETFFISLDMSNTKPVAKDSSQEGQWFLERHRRTTPWASPRRGYAGRVSREA